MEPMQPAIFIDRDGVIIENRALYVRTWDDVEIFPQALAALALPALARYRVVIVTNQAGIGKGLIPLETAHEINRRLVEIIRRAGGRVDGVYMCPHAPGDGCACRKPQPGLILQAAGELDLDLGQSILIGDALSDVQAGHAAGIPTTILVRTGRGAEQERLIDPRMAPQVKIFDSLHHALTSLEDLAD